MEIRSFSKANNATTVIKSDVTGTAKLIQAINAKELLAGFLFVSCVETILWRKGRNVIIRY